MWMSSSSVRVMGREVMTRTTRNQRVPGTTVPRHAFTVILCVVYHLCVGWLANGCSSQPFAIVAHALPTHPFAGYAAHTLFYQLLAVVSVAPPDVSWADLPREHTTDGGPCKCPLVSCAFGFPPLSAILGVGSLRIRRQAEAGAYVVLRNAVNGHCRMLCACRCSS